MVKTSKTGAPSHGSFRKLSDSEILLFISDNLQPAPAEVLAKLRLLKDILAEQDTALADWPKSSGKERFSASHLKVKQLIAEIEQTLLSAQSGGPKTVNKTGKPSGKGLGD